MGAGLVTPLVLIVAVVEPVCPPLKKASAANGVTAPPPELTWYTGVMLTGLITSVTITVCVRLPLVPVIVRVELPVGVLLLVEMVSVEVPAPLIDAGLKLAVAPAGKPLALSVTAPLKPLTAPIVVV